MTDRDPIAQALEDLRKKEAAEHASEWLEVGFIPIQVTTRWFTTGFAEEMGIHSISCVSPDDRSLLDDVFEHDDHEGESLVQRMKVKKDISPSDLRMLLRQRKLELASPREFFKLASDAFRNRDLVLVVAGTRGDTASEELMLRIHTREGSVIFATMYKKNETIIAGTELLVRISP